MRKKPFFNIAGLLFIIPAIAVFGQSVEFKSQHFSVDNGLPHSRIWDIYQDHQGYLWIATLNGLARYDGYKFKTFLPDTNNPYSVPSTGIIQISEDRYGNLWLAVADGYLTKYDPRTNRFWSFTLREDDSTTIGRSQRGWHPSRLFIDSFDNIWIVIGNENIARFDIHSEKLVHYHHDAGNSSSISHDIAAISILYPHPLTPIIEDVHGNLWIGTLRGLNLYNRTSDDFIPASRTSLRSGILDTAMVVSLFEDNSKRLWIATRGQGVFRFDHRTKKLIQYSHANSTNCRVPTDSCGFILQDGMNRLWAYTKRGLSYYDTEHENFILINGSEERPGKNRLLRPFYGDKDGTVWTVSGTTIFLVKGETHQIQKYADNVSTKKNLGEEELTAFYKDSFNSLWFSRDFRGVVKLNPSSCYFEHIPAPIDKNQQKPTLYGIKKCQNDPSKLWVGSSNGLMQYDQVNRKLSFIQDKKLDTMLSDGIVFSKIPNVLEDKEHSLWIASYGSGLIKRLNNGKYVQYLPKENDSTSISSRDIWCLFQDSRNMIWIGAHDGLNSYDPVRNSFIRYSSAYDSGPPPDVNVMCFAEDEKHRVWVGTVNGLYCYDRKKNTFSYYLEGLLVLTLCFDSGGRLWIGTDGKGLGLFNSESGTVKLFAHPLGITCDKVNIILEDEDGFLWCATEGGGLLKFDPQSERFIMFTEQHGLPGNCLHVGGVKMDDGTIYLSTLYDGLVKFHPKNLKLNSVPPNILLTDFKIGDNSLPIGGDSPLKQDVPFTREIQLHHFENDITIEMTALHFAYPEYNQYQYWLENYDDGWRHGGTNRLAVYTNLNPGKYIFHAMGSNGDGIWSEKEATLVIIIHPPWWQTRLAYIVYVLMILGTAYMIIRWVRHREQEKSRIRETELHAQTAEAHAHAAEMEAIAYKAEDERKTRELEEARNLQLAMLPKQIPHVPHLDIAVYMKTATEVGGDYYDFNLSKSGVLTIAVGDATGHGMRAGNMVVITKSLFKDLGDDMRIPEFFHKCTGIMKNMNMEKIFMALSIVRIKGNNVCISSSGMPPAFLLRKAESSVEKILIKGMPLGAVNNFPYQERSFTMSKGDILLLLSDGLPELFNEQMEMYEYERIVSILKDSGESASQQVIDRLLKSAKNWCGNKPQADDMTFVVVKEL